MLAALRTSAKKSFVLHMDAVASWWSTLMRQLHPGPGYVSLHRVDTMLLLGQTLRLMCQPRHCTSVVSGNAHQIMFPVRDSHSLCCGWRSLPHLDPLGLKSLDDLGANGIGGGGNGLGPGSGPGQSVSGFSLATDSYPETAFHGACCLSGLAGWR